MAVVDWLGMFFWDGGGDGVKEGHLLQVVVGGLLLLALQPWAGRDLGDALAEMVIGNVVKGSVGAV